MDLTNSNDEASLPNTQGERWDEHRIKCPGPHTPPSEHISGIKMESVPNTGSQRHPSLFSCAALISLRLGFNG
jgi:hypothetical protein